MDNGQTNETVADAADRAAELDARLGAMTAPGPVERVFDVLDPVEALAASIGAMFRERRELFLRTSDRQVMARGADGVWEPMDSTWAVSYFPAHGVKWTKGKKRTNVGERLAAQILRATEFRDCLPRLTGVNQVRLPVLSRTELDERDCRERRGFGRLRLLPAGYDEETGIWTEDTLEYPVDLHPEEAKEWFDGLLQYFEWTDPARLAVQMAATLSVFCREMFEGRPPLFVWNSNLPGSGKSRLAEMIGRMILGDVGAKVLDQRNQRELEQLLNTCAMSGDAVVWFDDVEGKVYSPELRAWATAKSRGGRILGGNRMFQAHVRAATFLTGTQLKIDEHLGRRSLWVDLFPRQAAGERILPEDATVICGKWMDDDANRRMFLAACWACVRQWDEAHRPLGSRASLESFEGWSEVIPGMVMAMGWGDCLLKFEAPDAGDLDTAESVALVHRLIQEHAAANGGKGWCDSRDIISTARVAGLFRHVLGELDLIVEDLDGKRSWRWETKSADGEPTDGEKRRQAARWRDAQIDSRWGKLWGRLACAGRVFTVAGKQWQFGGRKSRGTMRYEIVAA